MAGSGNTPTDKSDADGGAGKAKGQRVAGRPRWRRRKDARPAELLSSALALFAEHGYAATRLDDVAERAGVTKGTLYLYYKDKEGLFRAAVTTQAEVLVEVVTGLVTGLVPVAGEDRRGAAGDIAERLRATVEIMADAFCQPEAARLSKIILAEATSFPDIATQYRDKVVLASHAVLAGLIDQGIRVGEFRDVPRNEAARSLLSPLFMLSASLAIGGFQEKGTADPKQQIGVSLDIWLRGICLHPDEAITTDGAKG